MEDTARLGLLEILENADKCATLAINSLHSPFSDQIWLIFSNKEIWFPLYLAVMIFLFIRLGWKRALIVTLSCVLTVVICDQLANITKEGFERLRPCWDDYMLACGLHELGGKSEWYKYGFYSAHAANALGFAVCSSLGFRNDKRLRYRGYAWPVCIWGILVGTSRIFAGQHFLGDVLVGFAVGAAAGYGCAKLAGYVISRLSLRTQR